MTKASEAAHTDMRLPLEGSGTQETATQVVSRLANEALAAMNSHRLFTSSAVVGLAAAIPVTRGVSRFLQAETLSTELSWADRLVGAVTKSAVVASDNDLAIIARQRPNIQKILFNGEAITDDGMTNLSALNRLKTLDIAGSQITDAGMKAAGLEEGLPRLENFLASDSAIGDGTVSMLANRKNFMNYVDVRGAGGITRSAWPDLTRIRTAHLGLNYSDRYETPVNQALHSFSYENFIDKHPLNMTKARFGAWLAPAASRF